MEVGSHAAVVSTALDSLGLPRGPDGVRRITDAQYVMREPRRLSLLLLCSSWSSLSLPLSHLPSIIPSLFRYPVTFCHVLVTVLSPHHWCRVEAFETVKNFQRRSFHTNKMNAMVSSHGALADVDCITTVADTTTSDVVSL